MHSGSPWFGPPPTWSLIDEIEERSRTNKAPGRATTPTRPVESSSSGSLLSVQRCHSVDYVVMENRNISYSAPSFSRHSTSFSRVDERQIDEDLMLARFLQEEEDREAQRARTIAAQRERERRTSPPPLAVTTSSSYQVHRGPTVLPADIYETPWSRRSDLVWPTTPPPAITFDFPKRFMLSKRSWSWGGEMYIRDELGEEVFRVKGKLLSVGARLKIVDLKGVELAYIRQRLAFRKPYYEVWKWNTLAATLKGKKHRELTGDCYADGSRLTLAGRPKELDYELRRGTGALAHGMARVFSTTLEDYVVEVGAKEDVVLVLAMALIVDRVNHCDW